MATPGTREGSASMVEGSNEQSLASKPVGWLAGIRQFWHEVALEMKKVSWPTRTEVVNTTIIVVIAIFFFAFYLFLTDIVFTYLINGIEWVAAWLFG
jgi:preprotein translocase subunit SecE